MGFLDDDINSFLVLASVVCVIPSVLFMRWHPGWWVVSIGTVSFLLNAVLAADGIVDSFQIDGTGRKTAIGAAIYSAIATVSSAVGTYRMGTMDFKAKGWHVLGALILSGIGGLAAMGLVGMQLTYKDDHPHVRDLPKTLCALKAPICSPRFAIAVALLWVSLLAQIIIDCLDEGSREQLKVVLQAGRLAGAAGFGIITVGAYRSYRPDEPEEPKNLYGRLTLMVTATAPYVGYAATSWVQNRTHHARAVALRQEQRHGQGGNAAAYAVEQGVAWGGAGGAPVGAFLPPPAGAYPPPVGEFPPPAAACPPPGVANPPPGVAFPPPAPRQP